MTDESRGLRAEESEKKLFWLMPSQGWVATYLVGHLVFNMNDFALWFLVSVVFIVLWLLPLAESRRDGWSISEVDRRRRLWLLVVMAIISALLNPWL